jgi:ABC-2 type transport system ATP-binding protein
LLVLSLFCAKQPNMAAIQIHQFTKTFGSFTAISNIDLSVDPGDIFGFIGPNGAGKSTTIKSLLNFIFPTSGTLQILGKDCVTESTAIKKITGYVPSEVRYYANTRVDDLIKYAQTFHPQANKNRTQYLCDAFEVNLNKKIKELSLGNKKKVALVQAMLHSPQLIILDEPTNGLDPLMQARLLEVLKEENKKGTTIFFSSHNLAEVQNFCKRVAIIKAGKIVDVKDLTSAIDAITKITLRTPNDLTSLKNEVGMIRMKQVEDVYEMEYSGDHNLLIKLLSAYTIQEIEIVKLGIEETFMKYYT